MFYPVSTKTFKFKVIFGTPGMRIVTEIILINSGNKFESFKSSVISNDFMEIASTVYQLKSKRLVSCDFRKICKNTFSYRTPDLEKM